LAVTKGLIGELEGLVGKFLPGTFYGKKMPRKEPTKSWDGRIHLWPVLCSKRRRRPKERLRNWVCVQSLCI